jgi:serine/threonine protein kinase
MLTGVSPFSGRTYQEVLLKNKNEDVDLSGIHWSYVSKEAKDLVAMMVARDPKNRCTAKEALEHPWFSLEHTRNKNLSNAQMNMKKYQAEGRFNVSKIKPEFSMVTCTPLLNSRFNGKDSPLIVPKPIHRRGITKKVPDTFLRRREPEEKKDRKAGLLIRDIHDKYKHHKETLANDSGDFDEDYMDEKPIGIKENIKAKNSIFPQGNIPMTPVVTYNNKFIGIFNTPLQNKGSINTNKSVFYLQQLAGIKLTEEAKDKINVNPFISEHSMEQAEDGKGVKRESTPKLVARGFKKPEELIAKDKKVLAE